MLGFPLQLIPGAGIEGARFGEPRSAHRDRLGACASFRRGADAAAVDLYAPSLVSLEYDKEDRLVRLQLVNNLATAYWDGVQLVDEPVEAVRDAMRNRGHHPVAVGDVDFYPELGLRLGVAWTDMGGPEEDREGDLVREVGLVEVEAALEELRRSLGEQRC